MTTLKNPSILAAMSGITTGKFANYCLVEGQAGMVTIGGFPVGKDMIIASKEIAQRGRSEFVLRSGNESKSIFKEASRVSFISKLIINFRFNNISDAKKIANSFSNLFIEKPIIEINAHCRQPEIMERGGGQGLLQRLETLYDIIKAFYAKDFRVSLKFRGNAIHPSKLIPKINDWQLDFLHIDSYRLGENCTNLQLLKEYSKRINLPVIGNNSVTNFKSAQDILNTGALAFSVARAAQKNPLIFKELVKSL